MGLLIKLKNGDTALKSLKYGNDRPGGGDSGQPYIKDPIDEPTSPLDVDVFIRGGLKAPSSALEDVSRLTKYFFDLKNPSGILFTVKQNVLSRISPKTEASFGLAYGGFSREVSVTGVTGGAYTGDVTPTSGNGVINAGVYTPLSTLAQAGVGFTGTHLNKQGIDPTGLSNTLSIRKYQDVVASNNRSIPETPKVPLSLARKSQRANQKAARKVSNLLDQQTQTNAELNANFQGLDDLPFDEFNQQTRLQKTVSKFLSRWDKYLDEQSIKKLQRKEVAADEAINQAASLNQQVEDVLNSPKVYTNRLLKLWDSSGLNLNNAFSLISSILYSYGGGSDSVLGVGKTNIKFATTNDGVTPSRTNNLPIKDPTRPEIYYRTSNIFGDNSVSIKYASKIEVSEEELFGSSGYLENQENQPFLDIPHDEYLEVFDGISFTYSLIEKPLTKYKLRNIFNEGVSTKWNSLYSNQSQNLFGKDSKENYFKDFVNTSLNRLGLPTNPTSSFNETTETSPYATWDQDQFNNQDLNLDHATLSDFRNSIIPPTKTTTFLSKGYFYNGENMFNYSPPGQKGNISDYTKGKGIYGVVSPLDKITASPIYKSNTSLDPFGRSNEDEYQDLVPFRIAILNNELQKGGIYKKFMHFRAFIDSFSDGYSAEWKGIEYMGRAEKFYKYSGFSRDINISFTVVAQSRKELTPMYDKLNFLASSLAPEYLDSSTTGYMAGNIAYMTVGDYLVEQPGIITSLDYDIPEESPWETARDQAGDLLNPNDVRRLPFMIKVKLKFIPIHKFRPSKQSFKNAPKGKENSTTLLQPGNQRYMDQNRPPVTIYDKEAGENLTTPYDEEFDEQLITDPVIPAETLEGENVLQDAPTVSSNTSDVTGNQGNEVTGLDLNQSAFNQPDSFINNTLF